MLAIFFFVTNITKMLNVCYNFINTIDIIQKKDKIYNIIYAWRKGKIKQYENNKWNG